MAAIALLVTLAGCAVLGGAKTDGATVTPAPVPTVATGEATLPPGVTGNGVADVGALVRAHAAAAAATSYDWRDRKLRVYETGTTVVTFARRITFVDGRTYYRTLDPRPMFARGEYERPLVDERYADGQRRYSLRRRPDGTEYTVDPATDASRRLARVSAQSVGIYLAVPDATVAVHRSGGERLYHVTAHRDRVHLSVPLVGDVYNYTVRAVVTPRGLVTRLNATYWTGRDGTGTRVEYAYRFRNVGNATVDPPAWVTRANERTALATAT